LDVVVLAQQRTVLARLELTASSVQTYALVKVVLVGIM
jgi:hypothetical protein